jgi:asparagine synthase (glutamine-hydrolysing)
MCGIAGIVRWSGEAPAVEDVQVMCDVITHRGPDDEGFYQDECAALGMRRLSIIDLQTGHQPVSNEDGTVWVVLNGEIYNFKELRQELQARGHRFSTTSDTETIVHLYEDFGAGAVEKLRGMFAFALWDVRRRQLLVARDRLGIKPLYYRLMPGGIAFASELKSILQAPGIERRVNLTSLGHFLSLGGTPATESIVEGVQKLEPGCFIHVVDGRAKFERYWSLQFADGGRGSESDLIEELRALLRESVDIHLRSDVPLGAFLSGGIDSSAVVATMTGLLDRPVKTFSIGSRDPRFDESAYARQVSAAFATEHHELILEPHQANILEDLAWLQDEPLGDPSLVPTYLVSKLAAEHVKVVLSGDGGDEIFGGYDRYLVEQREQQRDKWPRAVRSSLAAVGRAMPEGMKGRNFLRHLGYEGPRRYLDSMSTFGPLEQQRLLDPAVLGRVTAADPYQAALAHLRASGHWLSGVQHWDVQAYLPLDILPKVDRMTMAHSIEARPVLLDHKLVEFAARVPPDLRLKNGTTKYLFKRAMRGVLPDAVIDRPKRGFGIPLGSWFRGDWASFVRDLLLSDRCHDRGLFRRGYLERLIQLNDGGRDMSKQLWTLVSIELWCRAFLDAGGKGRWLPRRRRAAAVSRPSAAVVQAR